MVIAYEASVSLFWGPGALCVRPTLSVSGSGAFWLFVSGLALVVSGPDTLYRWSLCRALALCVGVRRSLCQANALCVGAPAISVSGQRSLCFCVGPGSVCPAFLALCVSGHNPQPRSPTRGPRPDPPRASLPRCHPSRLRVHPSGPAAVRHCGPQLPAARHIRYRA